MISLRIFSFRRTILFTTLLVILFSAGIYLKKNMFKNSLFLNKYQTCEIEKITHIPLGSILIIGHAYSSAALDEKVLFDNRVMKLIDREKTKINGVIFSGDVFAAATWESWASLSEYFKNISVQFYIAPGNHDVGFGENKLRDNFDKVFSNDTFKQLSASESNLIIEDSTKNNWYLNKDVKEFISESTEEANFLVRHHVPVKELLQYANSLEGLKSELPSIVALRTLFDNEFTIISGDSGHFPHLPRLKCLKSGTLRVVLSGVGNASDDIILVIDRGKLYQYRLDT